jgi:uncharacterized protein with beta-barrel porin domain
MKQGDGIMNKKTKKAHKGNSTHTSHSTSVHSAVKKSSGRNHSRGTQELVVVATSSAMDEAKEYETLLKNNDIPAMVKERPNEFGEGTHYAVYVPDDMADEAHVVIESQDAYDDFYDFGLDEENEDDLEGDIFED